MLIQRRHLQQMPQHFAAPRAEQRLRHPGEFGTHGAFVLGIDRCWRSENGQVDIHHQRRIGALCRLLMAGGEDQLAYRRDVAFQVRLPQPLRRALGAGGFVVVAAGVVDQIMGPQCQLDLVRLFGQVTPFIEVAQAGSDMDVAVVVALRFAVGGQQLGKAAIRCVTAQALPEFPPTRLTEWLIIVVFGQRHGRLRGRCGTA